MGRKPKRRTVRDTLKTYSIYDFDGSLVSIIDDLQQALESVPEGIYSDVYIEPSIDYYNESAPKLHIVGIREENDEEYEKRLEKENKDRDTYKKQVIRQAKVLGIKGGDLE